MRSSIDGHSVSGFGIVHEVKRVAKERDGLGAHVVERD
jgi:hypothetical protein